MGIFNFNKKEQMTNINGYLIDKESGELLDAPTDLTTYKIPSEVRSISPMGLRNMQKRAVELDFSDTSITFLPQGAFIYFSNLLKVVLPPHLKKMDFYFNVHNLSHETEIILPPHLEQFAQNHFTPHLTKLELEDTVTSIKQGIVSHNAVLRELIVPGSIHHLENQWINQAKRLEKVFLKEGIASMHGEAIRGCNNLTEIHIPASLKVFNLGSDDYRHGKASTKNGPTYTPTQEEIEKSQKRSIKLYKMVDGKEIVFEVKRDSFKSLHDIDSSFLFHGSDYSTTYRLDKKEIGDCEYIVVDIAGKRIDKKMTTSHSDLGGNNNIDHINIAPKPIEKSKKETLESLLHIRIIESKKIKDPLSNTLKTVLKTQRELSDELASLLEVLEEVYLNEGKIDFKSYQHYKLDLGKIYGYLIATAPLKTETIEDPLIDTDSPSQWELDLMRKYGMTWDELTEALERQRKKEIWEEEVEKAEATESRRIR